mmetsp:Transcript_72410/g.228245  ORF Transcript_72410/g.228245 Transcript_72410/m.228245 type:complete len:468 (-) Transcript_72410:243-1646(-)
MVEVQLHVRGQHHLDHQVAHLGHLLRVELPLEPVQLGLVVQHLERPREVHVLQHGPVIVAQRELMGRLYEVILRGPGVPVVVDSRGKDRRQEVHGVLEVFAQAPQVDQRAQRLRHVREMGAVVVGVVGRGLLHLPEVPVDLAHVKPEVLHQAVVVQQVHHHGGQGLPGGQVLQLPRVHEPPRARLAQHLREPRGPGAREDRGGEDLAHGRGQLIGLVLQQWDPPHGVEARVEGPAILLGIHEPLEAQDHLHLEHRRLHAHARLVTRLTVPVLWPAPIILLHHTVERAALPPEHEVRHVLAVARGRREVLVQVVHARLRDVAGVGGEELVPHALHALAADAHPVQQVVHEQKDVIQQRPHPHRLEHRLLHAVSRHGTHGLEEVREGLRLLHAELDHVLPRHLLHLAVPVQPRPEGTELCLGFLIIIVLVHERVVLVGVEPTVLKHPVHRSLERFLELFCGDHPVPVDV